MQQTSCAVIYESHAQDARYEEKTICPTVSRKWGTGGGNVPMKIEQQIGVRRLTPLECERLQTFPDGYTDISGASDTARYKALGNSMCVNVMRWIAQRMLAVDNQISGSHERGQQ